MSGPLAGAPGQPGQPGERGPSVLSSSAVMAAGTVVSRLSGFLRSTLLVAALGASLQADVFNIANTIPNMLYILLAGGVFNAVLVPQLVRAMKRDADGGAAYTNRVITVAALFLVLVSAALVLAAPLVMRVLLDPAFFTDQFAAHRESIIDLARYCLPQVFFYGMFVLVGQVLNARGSFGPMMWAPIANNVVAVAVLVLYLVTYEPAVDACGGAAAGVAPEHTTLGAFGSGQEALLGLGSTLGIAIQLLVLLPYLRKAGFRFQPRLDLRGSGLGHTFRLGVWTVLFVVANQVAYTVVVRIASSGTTVTSACAHAADATGYTVYSNSFLLVMVPHSIITVSLATAVLPRLSAYAADGRLRDLARAVTGTLRSSYALVVPAAALLPVVALDLTDLVFGWGAGSGSYRNFVLTLSLFALGLFFFTTHYLVLRGFYALELNRLVFYIQCAVAATNIGLAVALTRDISPAQTAPRLVLAYAGAYLVGAVLSTAVLSRRLGGLEGPVQVRFFVRLAVVVAITVGLALLARWGLHALLRDSALPDKLAAVGSLAGVGLVGGVAYLALARAFRISEVTDVTALVTSRFGRGR